MKTSHNSIAKLSLAALLLISTVFAEFVADADPLTAGNQPGSVYHPLTLTGTTKSEGWNALDSSHYPGNGSFPGTSAWTGPLVSQLGPNAGASGVVKLANGVGGGPYPSAGSVYFGGVTTVPNTFGGTIGAEATGTAVLSGVKTVVFHLDIGEVWTYDLYSDVAPVLTYTTASGTYTMAAVYSSKYSKISIGQVEVNGEDTDLWVNSRIYQFDLSFIPGPITSFSVKFSAAQHCQVYGVGLQQTTAKYEKNTLPVEVPEE